MGEWVGECLSALVGGCVECIGLLYACCGQHHLLCADVLACRGGRFLLPLCLRAHSSCLSTYVACNFHMSMGLSRMALSMLICANGLQSKLQNRPHCKDVNLAMFLVLFSVSRAFIGWCFCCGCIVCG